MQPARSLADLIGQLEALPDGVTFSRAAVLELLAGVAGAGDPAASTPGEALAPTSWRERLWTCPAETRLGVQELAEALGRPKSYVYRLTSREGARALTHDGRPAPQLPFRKFDGALVFLAADVRAWLQVSEEEIAPAVVPASPRTALQPGVRPITAAPRRSSARATLSPRSR